MIRPQAISPHPLGATLPALYQEDSLIQRFCAALDGVLAPDITLLDCFAAYLEPGTAPPDLLELLTAWAGLPAVRDLPEQRRRTLLQAAARLHTRRGTPSGIRELLSAACGSEVELDESGGVSISSDAGAGLPGRAEPGLTVRIRTSGGARLDRPTRELLTQLLELSVPAHLPWTLETA